MSKVHLLDEDRGVYIFHCPGCGYGHSYQTEPYTDGRGKEHSGWGFNGDVDNPTFSPSLLINASMPEKRCHLFLRDGHIQYCGDCHHDLAGKTVECPEWDDV